MVNWELLATKLLTMQTISWAYLCPSLFSLHVEINLSPFGHVTLSFSVWVCLLPCLLLTCNINKSERWAYEQTFGESINGTYGFGRRITALVQEVEQALGVPGDLVIFTIVSDASSPSSSLMKDADTFREEVQLELDSILGTQGGTCSRNLQIWRRSLCTEAVLPLNVPSHQISASLFSNEDTSGLGVG